MKRNVGGFDRLVRAVIGVGILCLYFVFPESPCRWLALLGILPLASAAFGSCMMYSMMGISTCPVKFQNKEDEK